MERLDEVGWKTSASMVLFTRMCTVRIINIRAHTDPSCSTQKMRCPRVPPRAPCVRPWLFAPVRDRGLSQERHDHHGDNTHAKGYMDTKGTHDRWMDNMARNTIHGSTGKHRMVDTPTGGQHATGTECNRHRPTHLSVGAEESQQMGPGMGRDGHKTYRAEEGR